MNITNWTIRIQISGGDNLDFGLSIFWSGVFIVGRWKGVWSWGRALVVGITEEEEQVGLLNQQQ